MLEPCLLHSSTFLPTSSSAPRSHSQSIMYRSVLSISQPQVSSLRPGKPHYQSLRPAVCAYDRHSIRTYGGTYRNRTHTSVEKDRKTLSRFPSIMNVQNPKGESLVGTERYVRSDRWKISDQMQRTWTLSLPLTWFVVRGSWFCSLKVEGPQGPFYQVCIVGSDRSGLVYVLY